MYRKIIVMTDLGPGYGGQGSIVHSLAHRIDADTIIKRGGAQGSHGVRTSCGRQFNFSQWGCGTLEGIPTFLSEQMVISPVALENEADALRRLGIYNPYLIIAADPNCICATPFHQIASELEELSLGDHPRGTVGTGVGRAYRMWTELGSGMTLFSRELKRRPTILHKLRRQLDYYRERYAHYSLKDAPPEDQALAAENLRLLHDNDYLPWMVDLFEEVGYKLQIRDLDRILRRDGTAIVECSHGVLTDANTGLIPHVSAIRTLPQFTEGMLRHAGYGGEIIHLAVHRAYAIRHGAGPLPTYDVEFTAQMLPHSHKDANRWQGAVRAGPLDFNLLHYALRACSKTKFDGLCLTWFDQILATDRRWQICTAYQKDQQTTSHGKTVAEFLQQVKPYITEHSIDTSITREDLFALVRDVLEQEFAIPLSILSVGPTELDKIHSPT